MVVIGWLARLEHVLSSLKVFLLNTNFCAKFFDKVFMRTNKGDQTDQQNSRQKKTFKS